MRSRFTRHSLAVAVAASLAPSRASLRGLSSAMLLGLAVQAARPSSMLPAWLPKAMQCRSLII